MKRAVYHLWYYFACFWVVSWVSLTSADVISLSRHKWEITCANKNITMTVKHVPRSVHVALMEHHYIKDPYVGMRDEQYAWIADEDWMYQTIFYVSKEQLDSAMVRLTFHGLDTVSKVLLNGFVVGRSDNMFVKYSFMVKKYIKLRNVLQVHFTSPTKYASRKSKQYVDNFGYYVPPRMAPPAQHGRSHPNFIRKEQCSFSWDWGPSFPSVGIWKDVLVEFADVVYVDNVLVHVDADGDGSKWHVHFEAIIQVFNDTKLSIKFGFGKYRQKGDIMVRNDGNKSTKTYLGAIEVRKEDVQLWWPRGYGKQKLYKALVEVDDPVSLRIIKKTVKFGFRTVNLVQQPINGSEGLSFYFSINSKPIFLKGANWIPADSFNERVSLSRLKDLFTATVDANMNTLRVWGGGIYEPDEFYTLADEMGVLIWQDLMFAVALYPVNNDFLKSVEKEMLSQLQRLQHHPSIIAWSGNNENEVAIAQSWWDDVKKNRERLVADYKTLYSETIRPIFVTSDRTRPFILSSPSNGDHYKSGEVIAVNPQSSRYGDVHYYNYKGDCWDPSIFPKARFASEYGYQSYPSFMSMSEVGSGDDLTWNSPLMKHRQHHANGNQEIFNFIKQHYDIPKTNNTQAHFYLMIYLSQIVQATCIKYETEHYRRLQGNVVDGEGYTMGALYWQLNDIWQGPSWSSIEYSGRWKMLHYYAKEFFEPTAVNGYISGGNMHVFVVRDHVDGQLKYKLDVRVYTLEDLTPVWQDSVTIQNDQANAFKVYTQDVSLMCPDEKCFSKVLLCDAESNFIFSQTDIFFTSFSIMPITDPELKITNITLVTWSNYKITVSAVCPAAFVWLETILEGVFSKNGFMMVDADVEVLFHTRDQATSVDKLAQTLKVISIFDTYV